MSRCKRLAKIETGSSGKLNFRRLRNRVNITLEKLRHYFRLGYELGFYNSVRYQEFAQQIDEIGRMTGGWIKSLKN